MFSSFFFVFAQRPDGSRSFSIIGTIDISSFTDLFPIVRENRPD
jgi:hypothetical protein